MFTLKVEVCWCSKATILKFVPTSKSLAGSLSTYQVTVTNRGPEPFPPSRPVIFAFTVSHPGGRKVERAFDRIMPGQWAQGTSHRFPSVDVLVEESGYMHLSVAVRYPGVEKLPIRILGLDDWEPELTQGNRTPLVHDPQYNETTTTSLSSRWAEERSGVYTRWGLWLAGIGLLLSTAISYLTLAHEVHWWPFL